MAFSTRTRWETRLRETLHRTGAQPGSLIKRLKPYRRQDLVKPTAVNGTR